MVVLTVVLVGCCRHARLCAAAGVIVKEWDVAVSPLPVTGGLPPLRVPPPWLLLRPIVIVWLLSVVIKLSNASRTRTVTAGVMAVLTWVLLGCTPKANWVAGPGETTTVVVP